MTLRAPILALWPLSAEPRHGPSFGSLPLTQPSEASRLWGPHSVIFSLALEVFSLFCQKAPSLLEGECWLIPKADYVGETFQSQKPCTEPGLTTRGQNRSLPGNSVVAAMALFILVFIPTPSLI